jgi:hypothetical protein
MIKKLWIAVIAIGIAGTVNAQDVKLGAKIGMNVSSVNEKGSNSLDSKTGWVLGATAEVSLTEKFSLQPELLFSQQGGRSEGNFTLDLNYITLPVMAKYYIAKGFSLEAGPQFSFLVKDQLISETGDQTADIDAENFDFSANLGLGYKLDNGIFFQTRYNLGLTNFDKNPDVKNGVFQMSLGYQF